jgi:predicted metalloprotease with PDZ domain
MKALLTAAFITLVLASAAAPVQAGDKQEKKVRKVIKIEKHMGGAWLGVALQDVSEKYADEKKPSVKEGAVVSEVVEKSPADSAGIKEKDVIVELNGKAVASADDVVKRIGEMKTGETASVVVLRDGAKRSFSVKLGDRPAMEHRMEMHMPDMTMPHMGMQGMRVPPMVRMEHGAGVEGMKLMELTDQLGKYFDAPDGKALLVTNVKKNSNARKAGIEAGDVIIKVGKMDIEDFSDLHEALKDVKEAATVDVQLIRKGAKKTVKLEVSKHEDMMMNFEGSFPHPGNFHFGNFGFDPAQLRGMMRDLQPQIDNLKKEIHIRIRDGKSSGHEGEEETEVEEESGTEL